MMRTFAREIITNRKKSQVWHQDNKKVLCPLLGLGFFTFCNSGSVVMNLFNSQ